jgi:hypothetical protein
MAFNYVQRRETKYAPQTQNRFNEVTKYETLVVTFFPFLNNLPAL